MILIKRTKITRGTKKKKKSLFVIPLFFYLFHFFFFPYLHFIIRVMNVYRVVQAKVSLC